MKEETRSEQQEWTPLSLAQHFHNIYERCAPEFGYETRAETRSFNPETPNGKLMIAVCSEILRDFNAALTAERQRREQATERYCLAVEDHAETQLLLQDIAQKFGWKDGGDTQSALNYIAEVRKPLVDALEKALLPIAVLKLTDSEKPYAEISPELRSSLLTAHDSIMDALAKVKGGKC